MTIAVVFDVTGLIDCFMCNREPLFVQSTTKGDPPKIYWVMSNFSKHIDTHLKSSKRNSLKLKPEKCSSPSVEMTFSEENYTEETYEFALDADSLIAINNANEIMEENDSYCIKLDIDPLEGNIPSIDCLTEIIYAQVSEQILHMNAAVIHHGIEEVDMAFHIENDKPEHTLQVADICADGSCLFGSLAHQLYKFKLDSRKHVNAKKKLRKDVVQYIQDHRSEFEFELKGCVYDDCENKGIKVDDLSFACTNFLEKILPLESTWGGNESLKAVSRMNAVNILIVNEHGNSYFTNMFDTKLKKTVILAFVCISECKQEIDGNQIGTCNESEIEVANAKRNHYNSVVKIEQNDIYDMAKMLAVRTHERMLEEIQADNLLELTGTQNKIN